MKKSLLLLLFLIAGTKLIEAQDIEKNVKERLTDYFSSYTPASTKISATKLKSVDIDYNQKR